jgi:metal-responsive CopG/Arc/MetJ family transcriptional regulator
MSMTNALKDIRVQIVISQPEIDRLDDWRVKKRLWSRSAAIRQLIVTGIGQPDDAAPAPPVKRSSRKLERS